MQDCSNSIANALELLQCYTKAIDISFPASTIPTDGAHSSHTISPFFSPSQQWSEQAMLTCLVVVASASESALRQLLARWAQVHNNTGMHVLPSLCRYPRTARYACWEVRKHAEDIQWDVFPYYQLSVQTLIAWFMGPTWGPSGADRTQVGPMNFAISGEAATLGPI